MRQGPKGPWHSRHSLQLAPIYPYGWTAPKAAEDLFQSIMRPYLLR